MIKEFSILHENFLLNENELSFRNNFNVTLDFISKFGYNNLKYNTTHIYNDVEYNIGSWRGNQRVKYNKLTSKEEREEMIKEFSILHENFLLYKREK